MKRYHLKIWEHFSDFIHSKIGNLSLKFSFVSLLSDKSPKNETLILIPWMNLIVLGKQKLAPIFLLFLFLLIIKLVSTI
jgi:hypothetical protein